MISRVLSETLVVRDLDRAVAAWRDELGWPVTGGGEVSPGLADLLAVSPAAHPRFALLESPQGRVAEYAGGSLRLLEGPADDERGTFHHIGLFNAELICADVDELHARLTAAPDPGFRPVCPPTTYDLGAAGGAVSRSFASRGPGGAGVYFTTYQQVPPPRVLPRLDHLVGPMMNSALAVDDRAAERFFEDVLGLGRRFAGYFSDPNINRLLDLPPDGGFDLVVYKGEGEGLIEVDFYDRPFAAEPDPGPGRIAGGNAFLTLETADLGGTVARAAAAGVLWQGPAELAVEPYGGRPGLLLRGPAGQRFELVTTAGGAPRRARRPPPSPG